MRGFLFPADYPSPPSLKIKEKHSNDAYLEKGGKPRKAISDGGENTLLQLHTHVHSASTEQCAKHQFSRIKFSTYISI